MADNHPRGYTLPVWIAAAARAALAVLLGEPAPARVSLALPEPRPLPVQAVAPLPGGWVLGQTCCDPGDGLDLTRGLVVWVLARLELLQALAAPAPDGDAAAPGAVAPQPLLLAPGLRLEAGAGVGLHAASGEPCLSTYARSLLVDTLLPLLPEGQGLRLRLVLPAGQVLAERTSNAAFGVVQGLALIGTRAEVQASAAPDQLDATLQQLRQRVEAPTFAGALVVVIGENGLDLATRLGVSPADLLKAGNWLGPVLVAAAEAGVRELLLLGYQGKLLKLAAGIFHTHHHLADGRAEVLTALAALEGLSGAPLQALHGAATVEAALAGLEQYDRSLAQALRQRLAARIEERCADYLQRHGVGPMAVGAALFDRSRRIRVVGPQGGPLLQRLAPVAVQEPAFGAAGGGLG